MVAVAAEPAVAVALAVEYFPGRVAVLAVYWLAPGRSVVPVADLYSVVAAVESVAEQVVEQAAPRLPYKYSSVT